MRLSAFGRAIPRSLWRAALVLALAGILWLALRPQPGGADWFEHADKLRHAGAFLVLWALSRRSSGAASGLLMAGLLAYGVLIEVLQGFTPNREPSAADVLADAVGIAVGAFVDRRKPVRG